MKAPTLGPLPDRVAVGARHFDAFAPRWAARFDAHRIASGAAEDAPDIQALGPVATSPLYVDLDIDKAAGARKAQFRRMAWGYLRLAPDEAPDQLAASWRRQQMGRIADVALCEAVR